LTGLPTFDQCIHEACDALIISSVSSSVRSAFSISVQAKLKSALPHARCCSAVRGMVVGGMGRRSDEATKRLSD